MRLSKAGFWTNLYFQSYINIKDILPEVTAIDVLAVILSVLILIKISVILIAGPQVWMKVPRFLLKHRQITVLIYYLGILISGYYLFTVLSVTEVMAVLLFCSLLFGAVMISYYKCLLNTAKKIMPNRKSVLKTFWFQLILWIALAVAVLWKVFS